MTVQLISISDYVLKKCVCNSAVLYHHFRSANIETFTYNSNTIIYKYLTITQKGSTCSNIFLFLLK